MPNRIVDIMSEPRRDGKIMLKNNEGADLFGDWMIQRRAELRKKGLLGFIQRHTRETAGEDVDLVGMPMEPKPMGSRSTKAVTAWTTKRNEASAVIVESLHRDQYVHIDGIDDDPLAMVEKLRKYHMEKGMGSLNAIYGKLIHAKKDDNESVEDFIQKIRRIGDLLQSLGEQISPRLVIACILFSLPSSYKPVITALDGDPHNGDIEHVTAHLQNFRTDDHDHDRPTALAAHLKTPRPVSEVTCFQCGKHGHYKSDCPSNTTPAANAAVVYDFGDVGDFEEKLLPF